MANNDQRNISGLESIAKIYDDGQCTICLGPHINKSLPECGHVYCFQCLVNWCGIKLECPSCKKPFTFFYHTIQSPKDGKVYTPERPLNSTDDPDGLFFVLHEPIGPNVTPEDPEFLFTFEQMLRITEIRPENPIDDRSNRQGNPEFRNPLARIFMIHEFHQASFFSPNSFWL